MRVSSLCVACALMLAAAAPAVAQQYDPNETGTFSIIARDPATGELGYAVQSKAFAAGNRAVSIRGGVGVIAHQASANPMYASVGFELLEAGMSPQDALDFMRRGDEGRDRRQVVILSMDGRNAGFSGSGTNDWKGHKCGANYCAQGNILVGPEVVDALAKSFESSTGPLAERLLAALDAGQGAGGDARGMQSGAIIIAKPLGGSGGGSDRVLDIRTDDARNPFAELLRLYSLSRSGQMLSQANERLQKGEAKAGVEIALKATQLSPENDNAWVALAHMRLKAGDKAGSFEALRKAVELNPGNKRMLPRNQNFAEVHADAEFRKIVG